MIINLIRFPQFSDVQHAPQATSHVYSHDPTLPVHFRGEAGLSEGRNGSGSHVSQSTVRGNTPFVINLVYQNTATVRLNQVYNDLLSSYCFYSRKSGTAHLLSGEF